MISNYLYTLNFIFKSILYEILFVTTNFNKTHHFLIDPNSITNLLYRLLDQNITFMHKIVDTYEEKTYLYRIIHISSSGIGQMKFPNTQCSEGGCRSMKVRRVVGRFRKARRHLVEHLAS